MASVASVVWALVAAAAAAPDPQTFPARNALTAASTAASTAATAVSNTSTTTYDTIVRVGYPEGLSPVAVAAPTRWLYGDGACFAFYRHDTAQRALELLEGGNLDLAILGSSVFGEAAERGANIKYVWATHISETVEGLVARVREPQLLRGKRILVPQYSTVHYLLLAFLESIAVDTADINLEFAEPAEIMRRWALSDDIGGAACWTLWRRGERRRTAFWRAAQNTLGASGAKPIRTCVPRTVNGTGHHRPRTMLFGRDVNTRRGRAW